MITMRIFQTGKLFPSPAEMSSGRLALRNSLTGPSAVSINGSKITLVRIQKIKAPKNVVPRNPRVSVMTLLSPLQRDHQFVDKIVILGKNIMDSQKAHLPNGSAH